MSASSRRVNGRPGMDTLIRLAGAMSIRPEGLVDGIHRTPLRPKSGTFTFGTPPPMPDQWRQD